MYICKHFSDNLPMTIALSVAFVLLLLPHVLALVQVLARLLLCLAPSLRMSLLLRPLRLGLPRPFAGMLPKALVASTAGLAKFSRASTISVWSFSVSSWTVLTLATFLTFGVRLAWLAFPRETLLIIVRSLSFPRLTVCGHVGVLMSSVFDLTLGLLLGSSAVASTLVLLTPLPWLLFALNVLASACLGLCT